MLLAAGDPASALGAAMAQQQFHTVLDSMSYDELYEYFGGMFSFRGHNCDPQRFKMATVLLLFLPKNKIR